MRLKCINVDIPSYLELYTQKYYRMHTVNNMLINDFPISLIQLIPVDLTCIINFCFILQYFCWTKICYQDMHFII